MKPDVYDSIMLAIETTEPGINRVKYLCKLYPNIKHATLNNIYSQAMQRKVKKSYHRVSQPIAVVEYYQSYCDSIESGEPPGVLIKMAHSIDFSPAMMAKIILEHHVVQNESVYEGSSRNQLNKLLRDTNLIKDRDLSYEVYLCLLEDDVYGPYADSIKHSIGFEYEFHLRDLLIKRNIPFLDEDVLRRRGYDKTPDIKLDIPIAVGSHVINWIESKASFGDEESHKQYLKDQFWSYWNRFGAGLVIYWFGFVSTLDEHKEKGILLAEDFPTDITLMDPVGESNI